MIQLWVKEIVHYIVVMNYFLGLESNDLQQADRRPKVSIVVKYGHLRSFWNKLGKFFWQILEKVRYKVDASTVILKKKFFFRAKTFFQSITYFCGKNNKIHSRL